MEQNSGLKIFLQIFSVKIDLSTLKTAAIANVVSDINSDWMGFVKVVLVSITVLANCWSHSHQKLTNQDSCDHCILSTDWTRRLLELWCWPSGYSYWKFLQLHKLDVIYA